MLPVHHSKRDENNDHQSKQHKLRHNVTLGPPQENAPKGNRFVALRRGPVSGKYHENDMGDRAKANRNERYRKTLNHKLTHQISRNTM
jgi:hypothetical protein